MHWNRTLKSLLASAAVWSTQAAALPAAGVINGQSTNLPLDSQYTTGLTPDEQTLIGKLQIYQDIQDKTTYYYSAPLSMAAPAGSAQAWSENRNTVVFNAAQAVVKMTMDLGSEYQKIVTGVASGQPGADPEADEALRLVNSEALPQRLSAELEKLNSTRKTAYIEAVKLYAIAAGITLAPDTQWSLEAVSQFVASMLRAPAVSVQVPVGFGFSKEMLIALQKYTANNAGRIRLNQLAVGPTWYMGPVKFLPDNQTATGRADYEAAANVTADVLSSVTDTVTSAGGVYALKYTYSGAAGIGHGAANPSDPLAQNVDMAQHLAGFLTQEQTLSYRVDARIACRFLASVREHQTISSARYPSGYIILPKISETPEDPIEIARCEAVDPDGAPVPTELDEGRRSALQKVVEAKKQEFLSRHTNAYTAALSLKQRLVDEARTRANAWRLLPLPTQTRVLREGTVSMQCADSWGPEQCVEWGKRWNYRRFKNDKYCKRTEPVRTTACSPVFKAVDRIVNVEVPAFYADKVTFDRLIRAEEVFDVAATETVKVQVTASHYVCLKRSLDLKRTDCSLKDLNDGSRANSLDALGTVSGNPIVIN